MAKKKKSTQPLYEFWYLLILSSIFFVSFIFIAKTPKAVTPQVKATQSVYTSGNIFPKNPILKKTASPSPTFSAQAVLAIDLDSMVPLIEKNPDLQLLPASTTKIVTALVAMEAYPEEQVVTINGLKVPGQDMGLVKGETITVANLLQGLLIYSGNDAAEVLAANFPGGRSAFIDAMNTKAKALYLTNTHFDNPTGFDSPNHYSTARDLVRVASLAMNNKRFADIVATKEKLVTSTDGKIIHKLSSTNKLLGEVNGVLGVKTGWTEAAQENLVTYLDRDGRHIMIAILGSSDRFGETKKLIDWVMSNYDWQEVKLPS